MKSFLILLILAIGTTQGRHRLFKRGVSESKNGPFYPTDANGTPGNFHGIPNKKTREPRETEIVEASKVSQNFVIMIARSTTLHVYF